MRWLHANERLRTDDALVEEARAALGFQRLGAKIRRRLTEAAQASRPTPR